MFHKMQRAEKSIELSEIKGLLQKADEGVLATVGPDGYPYTTPLNYVYKDNALYFHCALKGHKIENMEFNPKVSFCVVGETEVIAKEFSTKFVSVVAFGTSSELYQEDKVKALTLLIEKYSPSHMDKGLRYISSAIDTVKVYKIDIENITGKKRKK